MIGLRSTDFDIKIDNEKAKLFVEKFNYDNHAEFLNKFLGKSAISMIELEKKEGKYDKNKHALRLNIIKEKWQEILQIINEEIPNIAELTNLFDNIGLPKNLEEISVDKGILYETFISTKDIRDKYVLSRLVWDLGLLDTIID